jgi:two-component system, NarL family, nitrate/nitrite response regulator NarL
MQALRICVVSGTRVHREALSKILSHWNAIDWIGHASSLAEIAGQLDGPGPDVVLIDMATVDSATVREAQERTAHPGLIAFGVPDQYVDFSPWIEAGIAGYLSRDASLSELVKAIRAVSTGETWLPPRIGARLIDALAATARGHRGAAGGGHLTTRELQVLRLLAEGLANKEIAANLYIELSTVKNHVHSILTKLGAHTRTEAAAFVRREPHVSKPWAPIARTSVARR